MSATEAPGSSPAPATAIHAKEVAGYLAQCLSLLPMSVYLSAEQRQRLHEISGGRGKRLRFDPEFADPAAVLAMLAAPEKPGGRKAKRRRGKEAPSATAGAAAPEKLPKAARAEATRQELQARLQARLEQLRAQRKAAKLPAPSQQEKPAPAGDENGGGGGASVSGKLRRSMKRKEQALKRRVKNLAAVNGGSQPDPKKKPPAQKPPAKPAAPAYNKDGKILYSKFDLVAKEELLGSETTGSRRAADSRKRRHQLLERRLVPTGTVAAAANVGARLERLKAGIAEADPDKASRLAEKARWEKALARAEGVKVKDDPTKLARTAKRQAGLRRVKALKWQEREAGVQQRQAERQQRRKTNINARKDAKIKKKIERAKKRGRILPELHGK